MLSCSSICVASRNFPPHPEAPLEFYELQMQCMFPEKIPASIATDIALMVYVGVGDHVGTQQHRWMNVR